LRGIVLLSCLSLGWLFGKAAVPPFACSIPTVVVIDQVEMMPLTPFTEIVGATITTDLLTGAVTVARGNASFTCTPDTLRATSNGKRVDLPSAPFRHNGALYAPLRMLVTALKGTVENDNDVFNGTLRVKLPGSTGIYKFPQRTLPSPDSFPKHNAQIFVAYPDGSGRKQLSYDLPDLDGNSSVSLSPDGKTLLYCRGGNVILRDIDSHNEMIILSSIVTHIRCLQCRFTADGQRIFIRCDDHLWFTAHIQRDGEGFERVPDSSNGFDVSPDGKLVAYTTEDTAKHSMSLYVMTMDGKDQRLLLTIEGRIYPYFQFSRDGSVLAGDMEYWVFQRDNVVTSNRAIFCYELRGEHAGTLHQPAADQRKIDNTFEDVSPDGRYLLYKNITAGSIGYEHWLMRSDFTDVRELPLGPTYSNIHFSPDSTQIIYNEGDATYAVALDTLAVKPIPFTCPARLTTDGKYLLYIDTIE